MDAQALQQGLQGMSLQHQAPHSMQGVDPFAMRAYGSAHAMDPDQARRQPQPPACSCIRDAECLGISCSRCTAAVALPQRVVYARCNACQPPNKAPMRQCACSRRALSCVQAMNPMMEAGWPGLATDSGALGTHDFTCEVSNRNEFFPPELT